MSFSRKFCNSANCSTRCRSRGVKCCVMQEFRLERIVMFSFGLCVCGFRPCGIGKGQVCKLKRGCFGKQRLGTTHGAQVCGVRTCSSVQGEHSGPSWAPAGAKHLQGGCRMEQALPCDLHLSGFYPFPLLPHIWATATCKPAVKLCHCWTRINLKALEKSDGKLKTFLEVRKKSLMNDKEENRSQWDAMVEEEYSLLQNPVTEKIPQRKENKVLPTWQWMTAFSCTVAWHLCFPPEKQVRKERLTLFSEHECSLTSQLFSVSVFPVSSPDLPLLPLNPAPVFVAR